MCDREGCKRGAAIADAIVAGQPRVDPVRDPSSHRLVLGGEDLSTAARVPASDDLDACRAKRHVLHVEALRPPKRSRRISEPDGVCLLRQTRRLLDEQPLWAELCKGAAHPIADGLGFVLPGPLPPQVPDADINELQPRVEANESYAACGDAESGHLSRWCHAGLQLNPRSQRLEQAAELPRHRARERSAPGWLPVGQTVRSRCVEAGGQRALSAERVPSVRRDPFGMFCGKQRCGSRSALVQASPSDHRPV